MPYAIIMSRSDKGVTGKDYLDIVVAVFNIENDAKNFLITLNTNKLNSTTYEIVSSDIELGMYIPTKSTEGGRNIKKPPTKKSTAKKSADKKPVAKKPVAKK